MAAEEEREHLDISPDEDWPGGDETDDDAGEPAATDGPAAAANGSQQQTGHKRSPKRCDKRMVRSHIDVGVGTSQHEGRVGSSSGRNSHEIHRSSITKLRERPSTKAAHRRAAQRCGAAQRSARYRNTHNSSGDMPVSSSGEIPIRYRRDTGGMQPIRCGLIADYLCLLIATLCANEETCASVRWRLVRSS